MDMTGQGGLPPQYSGLLAQLLQQMQGAQQTGGMPGGAPPLGQPGQPTSQGMPMPQMQQQQAGAAQALPQGLAPTGVPGPQSPMMAQRPDPGQGRLDPETGRLPGVPGPMGSGGHMPGASQPPVGNGQNWRAPGLTARGYLGRTVF